MTKYNLNRNPRQLPNGDIEIPLTKGRTTIISAESTNALNYNWSVSGGDKSRRYVTTSQRLKDKCLSLFLHRIVMEQYLGRSLNKNEIIDHINGDTMDNRLSNLRLCTCSQNLYNARRSKRNSSGYKGVSFNKQSNKWAAYINVNYNRFYLGMFETADEAFRARCRWSEILHGEFVRNE